VAALPRLLAELGDRPVDLIHVGGELLTCERWQAAVMLLPPEEARQVVARLDARPAARDGWARACLDTAALAPYCVPPARLPPGSRVIHWGVGGVALDRSRPALRAEVLAALGAAHWVGVRDRQTLAHLAAAGIPARLVPDAAVLVAEIFGPGLCRRARWGAVARLRRAFPAGYLAVQFSADFGDDATLATLAEELDRLARGTGLGLVFFQAGAAPWHDDPACYRRLAARLRSAPWARLASVRLWDLCALIAYSRGYCGSSLHGRIVASAFALPRVNLCLPSEAGRPTKQEAYAASWEAPGLPAAVAPDELAQAMGQALAADRGLLLETAAGLAARCRSDFREVQSLLAA
jgi:hypothetical protein